MENRENYTQEQLWEKVLELAKTDALIHAAITSHQYGLKQWRDRTFTLLMLVVAMAQEKQVLQTQLLDLLQGTVNKQDYPPSSERQDLTAALKEVRGQRQCLECDGIGQHTQECPIVKERTRGL